MDVLATTKPYYIYIYITHTCISMYACIYVHDRQPGPTYWPPWSKGKYNNIFFLFCLTLLYTFSVVFVVANEIMRTFGNSAARNTLTNITPTHQLISTDGKMLGCKHLLHTLYRCKARCMCVCVWNAFGSSVNTARRLRWHELKRSPTNSLQTISH